MFAQLFRRGDRVVFKMDKENRYWGCKGEADGTQGVVLRRNSTIRYRDRFGIDPYFFAPGIYAEDCGVLILWDNGRQESLNQWINFVDPTVEAERWAEYRAYPDDGKVLYQSRERHFSNIMKVADLPDVRFYQQDLVRITNGNWGPEDSEHVRVHSYDWHWRDFEKDDGRGWSVNVDFLNEKGEQKFSSHIDEGHLELVARGNVWKEFHGEPLVFGDLRQEVAYEYNRGRMRQQRNPETNLFSWTLELALAAIERGEADVLKHSDGMLTQIFNVPRSLEVYKLDNAELATRVREETLKGFNRTVEA